MHKDVAGNIIRRLYIYMILICAYKICYIYYYIFQEQQYCNKQTLQDALCACGYYQQQTNLTASMDTNSPPAPMAKNITSVSEHVARGLAFLLVEQVSPDVMYNSVVWPEEDFMRVTVER